MCRIEVAIGGFSMLHSGPCRNALVYALLNYVLPALVHICEVYPSDTHRNLITGLAPLHVYSLSTSRKLSLSGVSS